jgi:hypothetical protein
MEWKYLYERSTKTDNAFSKLTLLPFFKMPILVKRNVSGATLTLKESLVNSVTVRQTPLTDIESPIATPLRTSAALEIVSE